MVAGVPRLVGLALARHAIDRATESRGDRDWVAEQWADPRTCVLPIIDGQVPVSGDLTALAFVEPAVFAEAGSGSAESGERYFLGKDTDGVCYFAVRVDHPSEGQLAGIREVGTLLGDRDAGLLVHAIALANWHSRHAYCAQCGARTQPSPAGESRRCASCDAEHFPRNDPAIIVLVTDADDRCLLGHQAQWPAGRFSTLAGFVEPGESLEQAVIREVREEAGIEVADPEYAGSQPWPFPSSLMLGFFARAVHTDIAVDGEEIAEARWFSRGDLAAAITSGEVLPPGEVSIARVLVETWYGEPLPAAPA